MKSHPELTWSDSARGSGGVSRGPPGGESSNSVSGFSPKLLTKVVAGVSRARTLSTE